MTGEARGPAVCADHTVTFAAPKPGLWFHPGRALAGTVTVADIGIDLGPNGNRTALVEADDVASWVPPLDATTHKWRSGVLVIGGSHGMTGAALLVAHAALRLGAAEGDFDGSDSAKKVLPWNGPPLRRNKERAWQSLKSALAN